MLDFSYIILLLGIALCAMALLSVASWVGSSLLSLTGDRRALDESTYAMRDEIRRRSKRTEKTAEVGVWNGYRNFVVRRVVRESIHTTSLYLEPEDGKPIPTFKPGQHITLQFQQRGKSKPLVRCYSLSSGPDKPYYRISVRHVEDRGDNKGPGVVSTIINNRSQVGDLIPIKAPSGHFCLDEDSKDVAVLLAAGIGITPMISMLERLIDSRSERNVVLIHGSRNGKEQQFRERLREIVLKHSNIHLVSCYSRPQPEDVKAVDYQVEGFASIELLKAILPSMQCEYYLCGPPAFMASMYEGLGEWGVEESRIKYEQFGPSTIGKVSTAANQHHDEPDPVSFLESDEVALWNSGYESILEMAEANNVPIDSGCRAGSCGTCETAIANGKVRYLTGQEVSCNPGCCLPCIAVPDGPLELEA